MTLFLTPARVRLVVILLLPSVTASSAAEKSHSHFRFTPTRLRDNSASNSVQLSEFRLRLHGQTLDLAQATVSNPGGNSPAGEGSSKLTDGLTNTKWLDMNKGAVVFQFPQPVTIDAYSFSTANDATERDPANWRLEGSNNGVSWILLDEVVNRSITSTRGANAGEFPLQNTVPPYTSFWHPDYLLKWSPALDTASDYNRSFIPLATRTTAQNVNSNARPNEGKVAVLTTFGATNFQPSQGSAVTHFNAYSGWQYTDKLVFWGGSAGEGLILAPSAPVIDAAHRNGVPVLGTVFFPPTAYGGQFHWFRTFTQKTGSAFPVADKLIEAARHFGFDGWFINQETAGGNSTDAANIRDFISYFRTQAPELEIMWYDAMNRTGSVGWQGELNSNNDMFMSYNSQPVSHSMFVDFRWTATRLANSRTRALSLGLDPYAIYTGVNIESGGSDTTVNWDAFFPPSQPHLLSMAFYGQQRIFQNSSGPGGFHNAETTFWSGQNNDPSNTTTTHHWKGLAHYIPATTPIHQAPFVTNFNRGQGSRYAVEGSTLSTSGWNNLSLQDILPTWRWIIQSTGTKLTATLDLDDAYHGGTSLRFTGTLDATNDVRLYSADLPVTASTNLRLVYKTPVSGATHMQVALAFDDAPTQFTHFPIGSAPNTNWNTANIPLGAHAGKKITVIGLRFSSPSTISSYQMRIGRLAILNGPAATPAAVTGLAAVQSDVLDQETLAIRLKWTPSITPGIQHYQIIQRFPNGSRKWLGGTPANAFQIPAARRSGQESNITIDVSAVGADFSISPIASINLPLIQAPDTANRLTGSWIGTAGAWNDGTNTGDKAFDGNLGTAFDGPSSFAWTGLDLSMPHRITAIRYAPRSGYTDRMLSDAVFEGANLPDFSDASILYSVCHSAPASVYTAFSVNHPGLFRYFRFRSNGHGNIAEIQVYGYKIPPAPQGLSVENSAGNAVLTWNAAGSATQTYQIERGPSADGAFSEAGEISTTTYTDTQVPAGERPFYRVIAINPAGASPASTAIQLPPPTPGFATWVIEQFGDESNVNIIGPNADPDGDQLPNLVEYALGLDPTVRDTSPFNPQLVGNQLRITYPLNPAAVGVALKAQWSDNLQAWHESGIVYEMVPESNNPELMHATAPSAPNGLRYMRLHATAP